MTTGLLAVGSSNRWYYRSSLCASPFPDALHTYIAEQKDGGQTSSSLLTRMSLSLGARGTSARAKAGETRPSLPSRDDVALALAHFGRLP
jgi:hypothetical protein